jgi:hypothetical protein
VDGVVGGIEGQHDLFRRFPVSLQEQFDKEVLDLTMVGRDLLIAALGIGAARRQRQTVQHALAGQGFAWVLLAAIATAVTVAPA